MSEELIQYNKRDALIGVGPSGALRPENFEGLWRMAQIMAASGFMPKGMEKTESVFVAVQLGMEVGLSPMAAVQNIACINGRPTIWGDAMLGLCRGSGLLERIKEDMTGTGETTEAICTVWRKGEEDPSIGRFSVADAKRAGLWGKAGPWQQYPRRMLQMRARSFALRDKFADVLKGLYGREEIEDERYMGPASVVPSARDIVAEIAAVTAQDPQQAAPQPTQDQEAPASREWPREHNGNLYDSRGVVWDGLVHSGQKSCNADGTWRRRKGVHPDRVLLSEARQPRIDPLAAFGSGPAVESGGTAPVLELSGSPGLADVLGWISDAKDMDELDVSMDAAKDVEMGDDERAQVNAAAAAQAAALGVEDYL
jgi:hypothetical protein